MPELPEVYNIARQMDKELTGKTIVNVEVTEEKCLNVPLGDFKSLILDKPIERIYSKGKWVFIELTGDVHLLISLGMGGDVIYHAAGDEFSGKYRFIFTFDDGSFVHIFFFWFGYVHAVDGSGLKTHNMTSKLGICPLSEEFTYEKFRSMLEGKKGGIKSYLMDQHHIAGIGNVYIQDILFKAGLHPNRKIKDITPEEEAGLYKAITGHLRYAANLGGLVYERDFYGTNGKYTYSLIGHRPGTPCPVCSTSIQEIKTGSTRSFVCERCQR